MTLKRQRTVTGTNRGRPTSSRMSAFNKATISLALKSARDWPSDLFGILMASQPVLEQCLVWLALLARRSADAR